MNHDQPPSLQPRHATARNQERATDGALVARFSELLGKPLIPWQRQVIDVISEIDPSTGTYWYDELVLTVQRQAGKTTITKSYDVRNSLWGPDRKTWYLAQTGKDANDQFRDFVKSWRKSRLRKLAKPPRLSNGSMALEFKNGSQLRPGGATEAAGHGVQGDLINVDEVWSCLLYTSDAADDMEPVKPTGEEPQGRFHPHDHHAPEAHRRETADMVDEHGGQRQQRVFQRPPGQAEGRRYPRPYRVL